jgi:transposase
MKHSPRGRVRILVATTPVDFRKGHDGPAAIVQTVLHKDPLMGTVFLFRAKRMDQLKLLYWDGTGLAPLGTLLRNALPGSGWFTSGSRIRASPGLPSRTE